MKILIVSPILISSEGCIIPEITTIKETMMYTMCMGFVENGHQVTLATAYEYQPVSEETGYVCEVLFFKSNLPRVFRPSVLQLSFSFYKYLRSNHHHFDLVVMSETFTIHTWFASIVCPSKTVIWQEMAFHQRKFKKIPSKLWHRVIVPLFIRRVKCVIPRSDKARSFIGKYFKNVSVESVDHGINIETFAYSREKRRQFICTSRLVYLKNVEGIIGTFNRLIKIKGYEDCQLLLAGKGNYREFLEQLVKQLNLEEHVLFLGFLTHKDLNNKIKESLALLVNTRMDLNMVSIPEAIVSGTPIVTNMLPISSGYINREKLGIAKDNWNEFDLIDIIENNHIYVGNCINYREKLTNRYCAARIVEIFSHFYFPL